VRAGQGITVVRVGTGVFYDLTGGDFPAVATLHNGIVLRSVQIRNPAFPFFPDSNISNLPTNLVRFDPHEGRET
jgi:hypothetical protein